VVVSMKRVIVSLAGAAGLISIVAGIALVSAPAALVTGGVFLAGLSWLHGGAR
jgi:hypothetical protein